MNAVEAAKAVGVTRASVGRMAERGEIAGAVCTGEGRGRRWSLPPRSISRLRAARMGQQEFDEDKRSPLRYPGGKTRALPRLLPYIPEKVEVVSPFVGCGSVELAVAERGQRVIGYDAFRPLVSFWQQALSSPRRLHDTVRELHWPMYGEHYWDLQISTPTMRDQHLQAAAFFALNRSSFSGATMSGGMSPQLDRFGETSLKRLLNFRAPRFWVSEAPFQESIDAHPDAFLFLDPPYMLGGGSRLYGRGGDMHAGFDHTALAEMLAGRSRWVLCYNDCPEVRETYQGCVIEEAAWTYGMSRDKSSSEVVIRPEEV